jgi:hypothetical protein
MKSKFCIDILAEVSKLSSHSKELKGHNDKKGSKTSFTAGQVLR